MTESAHTEGSRAARKRGMMSWRRVLLAALLAVGGFWWWTQPYVDQRLVGSWTDPDVAAGNHRIELKLYGDGRWERIFVSPENGSITRIILQLADVQTWDVRDGVLSLRSREIFFPQSGSIGEKLQFAASRLWSWRAGARRHEQVQRYQIRNVVNAEPILKEIPGSAEPANRVAIYDPITTLLANAKASDQLVRRESDSQ